MLTSDVQGHSGPSSLTREGNLPIILKKLRLSGLVNRRAYDIFSHCIKLFGFNLYIYWITPHLPSEDKTILEVYPVGNSDCIFIHGTGLHGVTAHWE